MTTKTVKIARMNFSYLIIINKYTYIQNMCTTVNSKLNNSFFK